MTPVGEHGAIATAEQLAELHRRIVAEPPRDMWWALGTATDGRSAAAVLIRLGLHPIMVHGLRDDGHCTCTRPDCSAQGKHPVMKGWQCAELDAIELDRMFATNWRWNVGLRMGRQPNDSHLIAIDVDGPRELLTPLEEKHGDLPATLTARTGSGGWHFVYRVDPSKLPRNRQKFAPGIDLRGEGGQIVVAPSRHRSGSHYRWVDLRSPEELPL